MERVTDQQLRAAHNGLDSGTYEDLLARQDAEQLEDTLKNTAGCLIKEGCESDFTSGTPSECPVEKCLARFDSGRLAVVNEVACQNPSYKPRPKYRY